MSDFTTAELAAKLCSAYDDSATVLHAPDFARISLPDAMEIQKLVVDQLGESVPAFKVAILSDGNAISAPIYRSLLVASGGTIPVPDRGLIGIEVEIAVRLAEDLTPEVAASTSALKAAIGSVHMGVEIIGTRLDDRTKAGAYGALSDNSVSAGYVVSALEWDGDIDVDGQPVEIVVGSEVLFTGNARHPFGGTLNVLAAYGKKPIDHFGGLKAGTLITTGSLCGIVPFPSPMPKGFVARLGGQQVEVRLG